MEANLLPRPKKMAKPRKISSAPDGQSFTLIDSSQAPAKKYRPLRKPEENGGKASRSQPNADDRHDQRRPSALRGATHIKGARQIGFCTPRVVINRLRCAAMAFVTQDSRGDFPSRVVELQPVQAHIPRFWLTALGDDGMTGVAFIGDGPASFVGM